MNELLSVRNLTKIFGPGCPNCLNGNPALDNESNRCPKCGSIIGCININFDVYPGEVLGIVGESGSGKSTILNCIYFNYDVSRGEVFFRGYENGTKNILDANSQIKRQTQNVQFGIVYQNPYLGLNFNVSGEGNVAERLLVADERSYNLIQEKVHKLFERVEFPVSRYKDLPKFFSGGMQQRIQIAKALVSNPSLILLDEPTGGLDVSVQARILDLIRSIAREMKVAMIMVSHDMQVIRLLCERLIVMRNGQIIEQGITDRVIDDPLEEYTQTLVHSTL
jgi:putative phosphonate transport system ATP-binding protein